MKKFNYLLIVILLLFVGMVNVDAKTYTSYKRGDKISVNINEESKLDFYVIENSNEEFVTAIYEGVLGDDFYFAPTTNSITGSEAETKLNELTSAWNNPTEIRLIKATEVISGVDVTEDLDQDFSEPSYLNIGKSYWTQDVVANGDIYYPILVTSWITYSNLHATQPGAPSSGGAIRPIITISKEYVEGGVKEEEKLPEVDDTKWKELKAGIKKNETMLLFNNEEYSINFDETDANVFKITVSKKDNSVTYDFILNYKDGIMKYESQENEPEGFELVNGFVIPGVIQEFCKLYDYDYEVFVTWLEENEGKLTLVGNGITYELKEYNYEDKGEGYDFSMSGDYFESLSINIAYPITGFTNSGMGGAVEEEKEPNANTGDLDIIMIASAMMIFAGTAIVAYKKRNS